MKKGQEKIEKRAQAKNPHIKENGGQVVIIAVIFFLVIAVVFTVGVVSPILDEIHLASNLVLSDQSYYASESGIEDMTYRLKTGLTVPSSGVDNVTVTTSSNTASSSTSFTSVVGGEQLNSTGDQNNLYRALQVTLDSGSGAAFHYGVQTGEGGITMAGSSQINGNVYTAGPITGSNTIITGDAVSAGSSGLITSQNGQYNPVIIEGNAYAHVIQDATISKNAYYQTITTSTVHGSSFPGSTDQPVAALPLPDSQIDAWESQAQDGGVSSSCSGGTYTIQATTQITIGPLEVPCNLTITASAQVTIAGPIWVEGNFTLGGAAIIKESSSLGANSVQIIADNPANDLTSGEIVIGNSGQITGSGNPKSFVLLVSQNDSAQNSGSATAIEADGAATGNYTVYSGHGKVELDGSADLVGVVGYNLYLSGATQVNYNTGLASLTFSSGSSGGYTIGSWGEVQ